MRIGLIVDGEAEFRSLPSLVSRTPITGELVATLRADLQPYSTSNHIAREVKTKVRILEAKRVDLVIILIDQEKRNICPGIWALEIGNRCRDMCKNSAIRQIKVVIKTECFENWLISDLSALARSPKRFRITDGHISQIEPNKADTVEAQKFLRSVVQGKSYDKIEDALRIVKYADPLVIAKNSRSFRRFLRIMEVLEYKNQSKKPAT